MYFKTHCKKESEGFTRLQNGQHQKQSEKLEMQCHSQMFPSSLPALEFNETAWGNGISLLVSPHAVNAFPNTFFTQLCTCVFL
jgi:hypothetical protein